MIRYPYMLYATPRKTTITSIKTKKRNKKSSFYDMLTTQYDKTKSKNLNYLKNYSTFAVN